VVAEGVDVPGDIGNVVEGGLEPSESDSHLVDEVLIVHVSLIGHAPATVDEGELLVGYEFLHFGSFVVRGLVPPPVEEGHFDDRELVFGMLGEFGDHGVDGVLHPGELGAHVGSVVIVVDCFEPSYIIMRMGDEVDGQVGAILGVCLVVMLLHHLLVSKSESRQSAGDEQGQH
jgi:hypothetical protein